MNKWVIPCTYNLELLQGPTIKNGSLIIIKTKNRGGGRVDKWTSGQLDVLALIYGEFLHV
jgi:hypothetical protein